MDSSPVEDPDGQGGQVDARLAAATERLGHAGRILLRTAAGRHGLSVTQAQIVLRLAAVRDGDDATVTGLTRWFDVRQPTVSDAVRSLTQKGLLTRDRRGRQQNLELTDVGAAVARELADWDRPLRAAFADQPAQRRGELLSVMLHAVATLHREGVITVARTCTTCRFLRPPLASELDAAHHCALLDAPLRTIDLRPDCPEHEPRDVSR